MAFLILFLETTGFASTKTGTTAMDFLALTHSVKTESLGGAVTALSDTRAMCVNPASIAKAGGAEIQTHYLSYVESTHFMNVSGVIPYKKTILGINLGWMDFGSQLRTTLEDKEGESGDSFASNGLVIAGSIASSFETIDLGTSIKYVSQTLDSTKTQALGLDLGLGYKLNSELNLAASITNLTVKHTAGDHLQEELRLGLSYGAGSDKFPVSGTCDLVAREDKSINLAAGIQYEVTPIFSLRAGYNTISDISPYSVGVGLALQQVHVDFSYKPSKEFGASYRVGIGVRL